MRINVVGKARDARGQCGREAGFRRGEWEGFEAAGLHIDGVVAHAKPTAGSWCPADVGAARQHDERGRVTQCDGEEFVVRQDAGVEELERAVFRGFDGGDVAGRPRSWSRSFGFVSPKSHQLLRRLARAF